MRKNHFVLTILLLILVVFQGRTLFAQETVKVFASIPPQRFLAQEIAGAGVEVEVLIKPGQEPHSFEITPKQMMSLSKAEVLFTVGFPFEAELVKKIKGVNSKLLVIDTSSGIKRRYMAEHHHHHEGEKHDHKEAAADPHTWLSPAGIEVHAKNIAKALIKVKPAAEKTFKTNLAALLVRNSEVEKRIKAELKKYVGREFFVFHPSFGYFADHFGLKQVAIEAAGKKPSARQLSQLVKRARQMKARVIFIQPQFDKGSAQILAKSIKGKVEVLDPLKEDLFTLLLEASSHLDEAFSR